MSQVEYLQSVYHQNRGTEERKTAQRLFFRRHGMDETLTDKLLGRGQDYLKRVSVLPASYRRISHGDEISIGTRRFKVLTGGGHALDQVMLYCAADKLFLSADQVLSKISPNVSVWAVEPDQNSLGEYLASLASLTTTLPYDVLRLEDPHQAIGRSSRGTLRADRQRLPGYPENLEGTGARRVP
jgi:glyoxylase-like metal-dependent hydrolase (beta-lactamase superfamily II)